MLKQPFQLFWDKAKTPQYTQRILILVSILACVLVLSASDFYTNKTVEVIVDLNGEQQTVQTKAELVEELLRENEINYTHRDMVKPALHTELEDEMVVVWKQAKNVVFTYHGDIHSVWTTADNVKEFLMEQNVTLQKSDKLNHNLTDSVLPQQLIEVAKIEQEDQEEEFTVPFNTIRKDDPSMLKGQEKVVTEGKEGIGVHRFLVTLRNGFEWKREKVSTEVIQEKQDRIVAVGTISSISRGGYVFAPSRVLENVTATAYSAGVAHTGKTADHPQYGVTRSGTRATEGRTIAVDPSVIPLGTWVYIEGIGLRRAEDTGGAVKGKKIDIYYEDDATAASFGLKRGYKIYIIGRQKPAQAQ